MAQLPQIPTYIRNCMVLGAQTELILLQLEAMTIKLWPVSTLRSSFEFLEAKVDSFDQHSKYFEYAKSALAEARENGLPPDEYVKALEPFLTSTASLVKEKMTFMRQMKFIEEDIVEEANNRIRLGELSSGLLERAFNATLLSKVTMMPANYNLRKKVSRQSLRKAVSKYYGVERGKGYCHLTGKWDVDRLDVKVSYLVPNTMKADGLCDLFGVREIVLNDPRNALDLGILMVLTKQIALLLHRGIKEGLDAGTIVIVPIWEQSKAEPTRWKCVLANKNYAKKICISHLYRWEDLDGRELTFLNLNRPASRFLYFRFIITCISMMKQGKDISFMTTAEGNSVWTSPGDYLRKSTLTTVARNISGYDLPPALVESTTFSDEDYEPKWNFSQFSADLISDELRKLFLASSGKMPDLVSTASNLKSYVVETEDDE
ncbi:hypothetical protein N7528_003979 [Penicillium herquei]|nr:hypothetical protein N7528_003979 [Penicillium herquei]